MKLQLDTKAKTIKIEGTVKLSELFDKIKSILPDWMDYSLESNTTIYNWATPIYIDRYPNRIYPWYSSAGTGGVITANTSTYKGTGANTLTSTYNIEL